MRGETASPKSLKRTDCLTQEEYPEIALDHIGLSEHNVPSVGLELDPRRLTVPKNLLKSQELEFEGIRLGTQRWSLGSDQGMNIQPPTKDLDSSHDRRLQNSEVKGCSTNYAHIRGRLN